MAEEKITESTLFDGPDPYWHWMGAEHLGRLCAAAIGALSSSAPLPGTTHVARVTAARGLRRDVDELYGHSAELQACADYLA